MHVYYIASTHSVPGGTNASTRVEFGSRSRAKTREDSASPLPLAILEKRVSPSHSTCNHTQPIRETTQQSLAQRQAACDLRLCWGILVVHLGLTGCTMLCVPIIR